MIEKERIMQVIFGAMEDVNSQLPPEQQLETSKETVLFGRSGKLDSLALVTLIVAIEEKLEEELEVKVTLADERAVSQRKSPFKTVETLTDYVVLSNRGSLSGLKIVSDSVSCIDNRGGG